MCTAVPSIGGCGAQRVVGRLARCEALTYARTQVEGRCASYFTATALNGRPRGRGGGPGPGAAVAGGRHAPLPRARARAVWGDSLTLYFTFVSVLFPHQNPPVPQSSPADTLCVRFTFPVRL